jgi:nitrogen fixation NifU-like protein
MFLRGRNGKIEVAKFTTDGCMFTIAACNVATGIAEAKKIRECFKINQSSILDYLECVPEDHKHCSLLAAFTFHKALRDFINNEKR